MSLAQAQDIYMVKNFKYLRAQETIRSLTCDRSIGGVEGACCPFSPNWYKFGTLKPQVSSVSGGPRGPIKAATANPKPRGYAPDSRSVLPHPFLASRHSNKNELILSS